jgi:DNA repair photolyase
MNTIYKPKGRAGEYGEYALNIYDGCPHGCVYCYVPNCLHKDRKEFHANCTPRKNIVEETDKRLAMGDVKDKHIFFCFTCDPFPVGIDHTPTREIIKLIHDSGNYVQILTKGELARKDWGCFKQGDIFGVTISCDNDLALKVEPYAEKPLNRILQLEFAKNIGLQTFVSCEPVFEVNTIHSLIRYGGKIDEYKIGKLNYFSPDSLFYPHINWGEFGRECERLCKQYGRKYYIKESLRREIK